MALTDFQEKPKTLAVHVFTGDTAAAMSDLLGAGSDVTVRENPRRQGEYFAVYGKQQIVDGQGNMTERTGTNRIRVRVGDYIRPKGPNSCEVIPKARFEALWEPAP